MCGTDIPVPCGSTPWSAAAWRRFGRRSSYKGLDYLKASQQRQAAAGESGAGPPHSKELNACPTEQKSRGTDAVPLNYELWD